MADDNVIEATGYFDSCNSKSNFDVQLKLKFSEEQLANALKFVAGIGRKLALIASVENNKVKLGKFNVYQVRVDKDANCTVTFKSNSDDCYQDNFPDLMVEEATIDLKAKILNEE